MEEVFFNNNIQNGHTFWKTAQNLGAGLKTPNIFVKYLQNPKYKMCTLKKKITYKIGIFNALLLLQNKKSKCESL